MAKSEGADYETWLAAAAKALRGKPVDSLVWRTPEGIPVKPLYTAADTKSLPHADTLPGFEPFVRGPQPGCLRDLRTIDCPERSRQSARLGGSPASGNRSYAACARFAARKNQA